MGRPAMLKPHGQGRRMRVIGHRGARGLAAENSLAALGAGIAAGADMLEFDVQRVGSELVLFHDLRVERMTDGRGRVDSFAFEALRQLRLPGGECIPTLGEALDYCARRRPVNVELKTAGGTAALTAEVLAAYLQRGWVAEDFLVSSFHLPELAAFHQQLPQVPVAALLAGVPLDGASCASTLESCALNISADFVDQQLIADAHRRGLCVYVYTVNEPEDLWLLAAQGVDGVFTDFPDRALAALASGDEAV